LLCRAIMRSALLFLSMMALAACSSSNHDPAGHEGHEADASDQADAAAEEDASRANDASTGNTTGKPATPSIASVSKMAGALHVTWKLNDAKLTGVELWRKKDAGNYEKAYSLPGNAKDMHDAQATGPGSYCYQVVTVRGAESSEKSAEKCGTP
jgi:hypothetical protein